MTVDDSRGTGTGNWTATVSSTDYIRTTPSTATIIRANMYYRSGPATAAQGGGTFTPGQPTAAQIVSLTVPRVAFSHTGTNVNRCSWIPNLRMQIPPTAAPGSYTGIITQSVA
ncbi:MAG TPA: hypothetical protein VF069_28955 [Streptosporangiaceae bacterium]